MLILSKNNPKIKELAKLKDKKHRQGHKKFLVEGYHLVEEARNAGLLLETLELNGKSKFDDSILVSPEIIKLLSDTVTPQNIIGVCRLPENKNDFEKSNKILFLNNLQDPGNVGTIIRLAKSFEFDAILIQGFDYFNPKVIRSSQGAFFKSNLYKVTNASDVLKKLKDNGFTIYQTLLDKTAVPSNKVDFKDEKIVVVVGNEGNGIDNEVKQFSDVNVYIPISFESLNVACATAIILDRIKNK
ncbi:RNA methyltransferase [Mycoplasma sp. Pen4]|uniref:TrmH family RNA methyltransferase n=1 Tax=Mycoplasma sp. Pen4 TaxID=640330 RepID=UPI001653FD41|nr:RNA methyltransferase [Mycoplasma sp. Pen4]QNM93695.1 RNA methyltransferase [Mycoplasma sp. Pen4]